MFLNISFAFVHKMECSIGRVNSAAHLAGFARFSVSGSQANTVVQLECMHIMEVLRCPIDLNP